MRFDFLRLCRRSGSYLARESLLLPVLAFELAVAGLVSPRGNFPLNDDWMYAAMVRTLLTEHTYIHHPFSDPIAVAHVAWGALFCVIFGFSYTTLRISTLVLAAIGGWATAKSAVTCGLSRGAGLLCAFLVLSNPIFMNLSYTFMTDVPFVVAAALSALFYLRAFEKDRLRYVFLGSLFGSLAFLVRQFGVSIGLCYIAVALITGRNRATFASARGIAAYAAPWLLATAIFAVWKTACTQAIPQPVSLNQPPFLSRFFEMNVYVATMLAAMGLFLLPMTCVRIAPMLALREGWPWYRILWIGIFGLLSAFLFTMVWKHPLPAPGNILASARTGALGIPGVYPIPESWEAPILAGWWIATVLGIVSGAILIADVLRTGLLEPLKETLGRMTFLQTTDSGLQTPVRSAQRLFLCVWGLSIYAMLYLPFIRSAFDRYSLPVLLPFSILYMGAMDNPVIYGTRPMRTGVFARGAAILCGALLLLFSVAGVHDYLAYNEARWKGLDFLRNEMAVPPEYIDGGFEFNGQYTSKTFMELHGLRNFWQGSNGLHWWVLNDTFTVSLSPEPGYLEIKRFPYFLWFGWRESSALVLRRARRVRPDTAVR